MKAFDFFKFGNDQPVSKGDVLISQPFLKDQNFGRTVILMCEHTDEGSFGFVLNKKSILHFDDVVKLKRPHDQELYVGGPVEQNTLHFLHRIPEQISGLEVRNGIYWSGEYELLLQLIEEELVSKEDIVFFLGYSGWSAGQLEEEMEGGSWMVYGDISVNEVFTENKDCLWMDILRKMGGKYSVFANYPEDPSLN